MPRKAAVVRRRPTNALSNTDSPVEEPVSAPVVMVSDSKPLPTSTPRPPTGLGALAALANLDAFDMDGIMGQASAVLKRPSQGQHVQGKVLRISGPDVFVDLPGRAEGWIARREVPQAQVGEQVEAWVLSSDESGTRLSTVLSGPASADMLDDAADAGIPVEGVVNSLQGSAGYVVKLGSVRAFMPIFHASRLPLADPNTLLGQTITVLVLDSGERTLVSRRALEERDIEAKLPEIRAALHIGGYYTATVLTVLSWGAFVDIDGIEARLLRHEASWDEVADLTTLLERGQRIEVRLVDIKPDGQIHASMRDPSFDPWNHAATSLKVGSLVQGHVTSVTDFGTFVRLLPGIDGLLHHSRSPQRPHAGQSIEVRILDIDPSARRIELGTAADVAADAQQTDALRTTLRHQKKGNLGTLGDLLRAKLD